MSKTTILGEVVKDGQQTGQKVEVAVWRRQGSTYVCGKPGSGKSGFLHTVIQQDISQGRTVIVIDPHDDLILDTIATMPEEMLKKTYLLDMRDEAYPFGLNLFEYHDFASEIERLAALGRIMHVFHRLWPKTEDAVLLNDILPNIALTFLEHKGLTFDDIPQFLIDEAMRKRLTRNLNNLYVKGAWEAYDRKTPVKQQLARQSLEFRLGDFLRNPIVRNILAQETSTIDLRRAIEQREILLIKLPVKGLEEAASLIGTILISLIHQATFSFADIAKEKRPTFSLFVDEFQNFDSPDFAELFKEGRKFGARVTIANQDRGDLIVENRRATTNAEIIVTFRPTPDDASELAPLFLNHEARVQPEDIYPKVVDHLYAHEHPVVVAFCETYVKKLQRAAEERTRRYHYKDEDEEIVKPFFDFGAGTIEYDERYVEGILDLLNTLLLEAQKKEAVNERLKSELIRQMAPLLQYVDYYNCLYCGNCTGFEPKVESTVPKYETCLQALAAFQGSDDDLLLFCVQRSLTDFEVFAYQEMESTALSKPYNYRPSLAHAQPKAGYIYYDSIFHGAYVSRHEHIKRNPSAFIHMGDIMATVLPRIAKCQKLLARYLTPQSYITYLMEPFKYYVDNNYKISDYKMPQQPQQQKSYFWQKAPQQKKEEFPKEWYEKKWHVYSSGYDLYPPNYYYHFGINYATIVEWKRGLASPEAFVELMAQYGQKDCKSKFGETVGDIWQTITKLCEERRSFYETRNTLEKLLVASRQELEAEIAFITELMQPALQERDRQVAKRQVELDARKAKEKHIHDAFVTALDDALTTLINDPLGKKTYSSKSDIVQTLLNLPQRHALVRVGSDIYTMQTLQTLPKVPAIQQQRRYQQIQEQTREKYCRSRSDVEKALQEKHFTLQMEEPEMLEAVHHESEQAMWPRFEKDDDE